MSNPGEYYMRGDGDVCVRSAKGEEYDILVAVVFGDEDGVADVGETEYIEACRARARRIAALLNGEHRAVALLREVAEFASGPEIGNDHTGAVNWLLDFAERDDVVALVSCDASSMERIGATMAVREENGGSAASESSTGTVVAPNADAWCWCVDRNGRPHLVGISGCCMSADAPAPLEQRLGMALNWARSPHSMDDFGRDEVSDILTLADAAEKWSRNRAATTKQGPAFEPETLLAASDASTAHVAAASAARIAAAQAAIAALSDEEWEKARPLMCHGCLDRLADTEACYCQRDD